MIVNALGRTIEKKIIIICLFILYSKNILKIDKAIQNVHRHIIVIK